ncbi:MAG: energy-coupling factor ABC transporter ATP-binding protein [Desulfovibrio sp.]|nr:energy-coupling factor ABC transporter ATP-binding protein [Desulfovibrio sp.]MCA1986194.1 energy-coupling factor ABC transporter ATP-binding protein [Desulfovibrio sp.]
MPPLYRLEHVTQHYAGREVLRVDALCVAEGECLGLTGPNGSGKSTLLRILSFLETPASGLLEFLGHAAAGPAWAIRRQAVLLDQSPYLLRRSVFGNVAYGLAVRGEREQRRRVAEALELVGLEPDRFASRPWRALSGGEARRVALAARLALRPKVLLLDEPTANLDAESAARILEALRQARTRWGCAILTASHDDPWLDALIDRKIKLFHGQLVGNIACDATPDSQS